MQEIACEPLESIAGSQTHSMLSEATERLRSTNIIFFAAALFFLLAFGAFLFPFFLMWAGWTVFSIYSFLVSLPALFSPESWGELDLLGFLAMTLVSLAADLLGAFIFVTYFILAVLAWNTFRGAAFPDQNIAKFAILADSPDEVRKATTPGIFGFLYGFFESALSRILSLAGSGPDRLYSALYKDGALILVTPGSRWPLSKSMLAGKGIELHTAEEGGRLVLYCMSNGNAIAIGVFDMKHKAAILSKAGLTNTD